MERKMNRRKFIRLALAGGAAGTAAMAQSRLAFPMSRSVRPNNTLGPAAKRPNIVLIMADDMGFSDIGCYGGEIQTPNLDRLAANGLRFTQFYNCARCCPTRASLLTGLYPHQTGVGHMVDDKKLPGYRGFLNSNCVTIAEALKPAGYATLMAGKWHVCHFNYKTRSSDQYDVWPLQRGFDRFYGTLAGGGSYYKPPGLMQDNTPIKPDSPNYYYTDAISDQAVKFINEQVKQKPDQPFFMYVAYTSPHWPLHAPEKTIARYKGWYHKGWDALRDERHKRMIEMGIVEGKWKLTPRDRDAEPWEQAEHKDWWSRCMEVYAAQVDQMDQGIGRIISALKKNGRLDSTLIFFLSDNGGCAEVLLPITRWLINSGAIDKTSPDGRPMRVGNVASIMPGPSDTYASYGLAWANASNTPFRRYKHWVHEGGIATPLIVHWPAGIKARKELRQQVGHVVDIIAACLDVANAEYPREYNGNNIIPLEGRSLVPSFENKPIGHEVLCWEHKGNRAIRHGRWKLVAERQGKSYYAKSGPWELYDVEADRTELNDLAHKYPEKVKQMKAEYNSWAQRCGVQPWPI